MRELYKNLIIQVARKTKLWRCFVVNLTAIMVFTTICPMALSASAMDTVDYVQEAVDETPLPADAQAAEPVAQTEEDFSQGEPATVTEAPAETALTFDAADYRASISFQAGAGIPEGTVLTVEPLSEEETQAFLSAAREKAEADGSTVNTASAYQIRLTYDGEAVTPASAVDFHMEYSTALAGGDAAYAVVVSGGEAVLLKENADGTAALSTAGDAITAADLKQYSFGQYGDRFGIIAVKAPEAAAEEEATEENTAEENTNIEETTADETGAEGAAVEEAVTEETVADAAEATVEEPVEDADTEDAAIEESAEQKEETPAEANVEAPVAEAAPADFEETAAEVNEPEEEAGLTELEVGNAVIRPVDDVLLPEDAEGHSDELTGAEADQAQSDVEEYVAEKNVKVLKRAKVRATAAVTAVDLSAGEKEYQAFDIALDNVDTDDYENGFEVEVALPENVTGKDFRLYHIHDGITEELHVDLAGRTLDEETGVQSVSGFTFVTDDFSQFVLSYTVDFHYNGVDYSIPGESQILLSELIVKLNIMNGDALLDVKDVKSVEFTDEHLVTVEQVSGVITYNNVENVDVGEKDFLLSSEAPFQTDETLTITLTDGSEIVVGVTDDQEEIHVFGDLQFTLNDYEYTATLVGCADGFTGDSITVPAAVYPFDDNPDYAYAVTRVGEGAFTNNTAIKSVTFKGDITIDGWWDTAAFYRSAVETVTFEGTTTKLCEGAFAYSALKKVDAGAVTNKFTIGDWAFQGCTGLDANDESHAVIAWDPDTTEIGSQIFYDTSFTVDDIYYVNGPEMTDYDDGVYTYKLYEKDGQGYAKITGLSTSYSGDYNLTISGSMTAGDTTYIIEAIGDEAFLQNTEIKSLTLNSSTGIAIGDRAFDSCTNMSGTLNGVTSVGAYAFWGTKISSVTMLGANNIGQQAFDGISPAPDFTMKGDDLNIPWGIISRSTNFKSITIDASGKLTFEDWAVQGEYEGNSNLETITIKADSDINLNAFQVLGDHKNSSLQSITIYPHVKNVSDQAFIALGSGSNAVTVEFMGGVDYVGDGSFKNFNGGKGSVIRIHNNIADTKFDEGSFPTSSNVRIIFEDGELNGLIHDDALTYEKEGDNLIVTGLYEDEEGNTKSTFTIPTTLVWQGKTYNVVAVKESAFKGLSDLDVTVAGDIEVRGAYVDDGNGSTGAFSYIKNSTVTFQGNTSLKGSAFQGAEGLTVTANGSSLNLGQKAFAFTKDLSLTTSSSTVVTGSGYNVFQNAKGALDFEGGVQSIGGYSFNNCELDITTTTADTYGWADWGLNLNSASVNVVLNAAADADASKIKWGTWTSVKSFTVNFTDKVETVWPGGYALGYNGAAPVTINYNGGVGEILSGAYDYLKGAADSKINISGDSAKVYEGSFPADANLTVNFDMYREQVTGVEYNDALASTTFTYKAHDYRKEGEKQILLSTLIENMGLTMEDGSPIDLAEVASVQFQGHAVNSTQVAGTILYNVTGETPVDVDAADYLLTSSQDFTNEEALCITLNDGTKIKSAKWVDQADKYNIDRRESIKLTDILRATGDMQAFEALGKSRYVPGYYYFMWRVVDKDNNTLKQGYDYLADNYDFCEITGLETIEYPGYARLIIYQYGAESDGWVTFSSGAKYIWLIQNKKPVVAEAIGPFIYKVEDGEAVITGVNPAYEGSGDVIVPATVELEDYSTEEAGVKKTYTVAKIKTLALMSDEKLTSIGLADSETPLLIEDAAIFLTKNLESVSGDRPVKFQSGSMGAAFTQNESLASLKLHIDDTRIAIGENDALTDVVLYIDTLSADMDTFKGLQAVENLTLHGESITLGNLAFNNNDALKTVVVDSESPIAIGAYAFKDKATLTSVSIPGGVTSIGTGAFEGCSALTTVSLGVTAEDTLTIEKGAFEGCTALKANNVTCTQIVKSQAGTATIPGTSAGAPLGAYLVKTDIEEIETIKDFADAWYKEQGQFYPIEAITYFDLSLVRPNGEAVTGVAVDVLTSNISDTENDNHISLGDDVTKYDVDTVQLFHLTDAEAGTVEYVDSQNDGFAETNIRNLSFHVDSLSPFAIAVLGNRYHDDQFWYEFDPANDKQVYITGVYDGATDLTFTGVTHDANAFKVVGFADDAKNAENDTAITGNTAIKSVLFTEEGIKNTIEKSGTQYKVPEGLFAGCTGLETVQFGEEENTHLSTQLNLGMNVFQGCSNMKTFISHIDNTFVHSMAFNGCTGLETVIFTGAKTATTYNRPTISNSAFVDAKNIKYLRLDDLYGVKDSAFMASAGTAFVSKGQIYDNIGSKIGKFNTYIYVGDHTGNIYTGSMQGINAPTKAYIDNPMTELASAYTGYEGLISRSGSNLKDIYFNCERSLFGDAADALDAAAEAKGITLHYNINELTQGIYLDGVNGNDETGDGSYEKPYKTFAKLKEAWDAYDSDAYASDVEDAVIAPIVNPALLAVGINDVECGAFVDKYTTVQKAYIKNTVTISADGETWNSTKTDDPIVLNRYPGNNKNKAFTGTMVQVNGGVTLNLNNVVLDGGNFDVTNPIIKVNGTQELISTLNLNKDSVLRNNKNVSSTYSTTGGAVNVDSNATLNMHEGSVIEGNTALYGGGVMLYHGTMTMDGGSIRNNNAKDVGSSISQGGGVMIMATTMTMSGGEIYGNKAMDKNGSAAGVTGSTGGGVRVGIGVQNPGYSTFTMTGGTISSNESAAEGGGINIESGSKAIISGGSIIDNKSHAGMFGGGGIYVNGDRGYGDGELELTNVLITDNTAKEEGGGLAACSTSDSAIYAIDGGAIYGNSSSDKSDIYASLSLVPATDNGHKMKGHVSGNMFNGSPCNWVDVYTGKPATAAQLANIRTLAHHSNIGLQAKPDNTKPTTANVIIRDNESNTKGGGIGSNGTVVIGHTPDKTELKWTPKADKVIYNRDMKAGETFKFTVYEEKTSEGQNSWWTRYNDVEVGTGTVSGGNEGEPKAIKFTEITLGEYKAADIGKTRTFLIVEDPPAATSEVVYPSKYYAVTVTIASKWDSKQEKEVLSAETLQISVGKILENGDYEFSRGEGLFSSPVTDATNTHNIGRIRTEVNEAVFKNYALKTSIQAVKEWYYLGAKSSNIPDDAKVTFVLYADGKPTTRSITIDGEVDDDIDNNGDQIADKDGEIERWKAQWVDLPVYRESGGNIYKIHDYDDDYAHIEYSVKEVSCSPDSYEAVTEAYNLTNTKQSVTFNHPHNYKYASATYRLYADDKLVEDREPITLNLDEDWIADPESWSATWDNLPVYRLDEKGNVFKENALDKDYARIDYTVKLIDYEVNERSSAETPFNPDELQPASILTAVTDLNRAVTFKNEYHASGELELEGTKTIKNRDFQEGDAWTFTVTAEEGTPMPEKTEITIKPTEGKSAVLNFGKISFTEADIDKTYTYTISETGEVQGVENAEEQTVTVKVGDNDDGTLKFETSTDITPLVFENVYEAKDSAELKVTKKLENREFKEGDKWTFTVTCDPANAPKPENTSVTITPKSGSEAIVDFGKIPFTQADDGKTYTYTITESGTVDGVTNDPVNSRKVTIGVTDNKDGTLTVTNSLTDVPVVFTNKYDTYVDVSIEGTKEVTGAEPEDDQFSFNIKADQAGAPKPEAAKVSNTGNGFTFGPIRFTLDDYKKASDHKYTYTITEDQTGVNRTTHVKDDILYDQSQIKVTVTLVYDDVTGELTYQIDKDADAVKFVNVLQKTSVSMDKTWLNGDKDVTSTIKNASITVKLTDGTKDVTKDIDGNRIKPVTLNGSETTPWNYEWKNLKKYDENGDLIYYEIVETSAKLGTTELLANGETKTVEAESTGKATIQNPLPRLTISGTKTWEDSKSTHTNPSLTLKRRLINAADTDASYQNVAVTPAWTGSSYTYADLDKYNDEGVEYVYVVDEVVPAGYQMTSTSNATGGKDFVNTELTEATVKKVWSDADNQDGKRPESIEVTLSNGTKVTLNADNNWSATVNNLPKYKDGEEITYSWTEQEVTGYTGSPAKNGTVTTFTNTHIPETTEATVEKVWDDADNQDGKRPESIVATLSNGTKVTLNAANKWTATVKDLPKYKDGVEIVYTWTEDTASLPEGYNLTDTNRVGTKTTLTNSYTPGKVSVTVTKVWEDKNDQDGIRPDELIATLSNGMKVSLNEENDWTATIKDLPEYTNGVKNVYTWTEQEVTGYTGRPSKSGTVTTFTNTHTPETTEATVEKVWDDADNQDGKRPGSIVAILSNGTKVTLNVANKWTATVKDLPKYKDGVEIVYTWTEDTASLPEGYNLTDTNRAGTKTTLTNSYTPGKVSVTVTKVWEDKNDQDGIRPDELIATLSNGMKVSLNEENDWTATIKDLPEYTNGVKNVYTWTEPKVTGYTGSTAKSGTVTTFTNTHTPETTEATVKKVWDDADNQDGIRPETLVVTLSNGTKVTLNEENGWTATVKDLPKYENGKKITYTWTEDSLPEGYTLAGNTTEGTITTIVNPHTPELTEATVTKVWDDADNQDGKRPESITAVLSNGAKVVLNKENNWTATVKDLPKYADGEEIKYTWTEEPVKEYALTFNETEDTVTTLTNTYATKLTEVSVEKVWDDADDQDGIRPESLTVTLHNSATSDTKEVVLNAENHWSATVKDLAQYKDGKEIVYTWSEEEAEGYEAKPAETNGSKTTFTNVHTPELTEVAVRKVWNDGNDFNKIRPASLKMTLHNNVNSDTREVVLNEENNWTAALNDVPKYAQGKELTYTWTEETVEGYTRENDTIEGITTVITNTHIPQDIKVEKALTKVNGAAYDGISAVHVGDVLTYTVTVTNTGEAPLKAVKLTDKLTEKEEDGSIGTVALILENAALDPKNGFELAVGASASFEASYMVPDGAKSVKNAVTATDDEPGKPHDDDETPEVPVEEPETPVERTASISVTKLIRKLDEDTFEYVDLIATDETFYVGLFTDEDGFHPYGTPKAIRIQGQSSGTYTWHNVPNGTYYVYETDADGVAIPLGMSRKDEERNAQFLCTVNGSDTSAAIEIDTDAGKDGGEFSIENNYYTVPGGFAYQAFIMVSKQVLKAGKAYDTDEVFYAGVFSTQTQDSADVVDGIPLVAELINNGSAVAIQVPVLPSEVEGTKTKTFYVYETDAEGNKIDEDSFEYTIEDGKAVTFTSDEDMTKEVTLVNTLKEEEEEEVTPTPTPTTAPSGSRSGNSGGSVSSGGAKTGDNTPLELYVTILAAAVLAGLGAVGYKKKRKK